MSLYKIALIRFTKDGRHYPVNCSYDVAPGHWVLVRMTEQAIALRRAEVMSVDFKDDKPCKNTVVCMERDAETYGWGPDAVENADDLDRFLTVLRWKRYATMQRDRSGAETTLSEQWPVAYEPGTKPHVISPSVSRIQGYTHVIVVGCLGAGYFHCRKRETLEIVDGKLDIGNPHVLKFGAGGGFLKPMDSNPYRHAAKRAEAYLIEDLDPPEWPY